MRALLRVFVGTFFLTALLTAAEKQLRIFFIDVEGGQATLFVTPEGRSLLVDTGWGYNAYRDANRIAAVARRAKIKRIDVVVITHYHSDHVGGVPQLVQKIPVGLFVDHGENRETTKESATLYREYLAGLRDAPRRSVKPGDHIPIKGMDVVVVSADGNVIASPLAGAGTTNRFCQGVNQKEPDPSENARSLGVVLTFGSFRAVDLGDLTWNKELELVCPQNKVGTADLLVVSHHGLDQSNSPALVHALTPRVAVIDNGSKKGGSASAWDIVKSSPGLQDIWQLHFADAAGSEHNTTDPFIANTNEADTGFYLEATANQDGSFELYNPRNKFKREYGAGR
jgi:beta-lactamase superfamily II metal-dependent hydrolase